MKAMQRGIGRRCNTLGLAAVGAVCVLAPTVLGGCSTTIQTPLPDIKPVSATSSLSQEERKKAVDELNKVRATHEQAAEQQIEESR
jgi:hypothetical protein